MSITGVNKMNKIKRIVFTLLCIPVSFYLAGCSGGVAGEGTKNLSGGAPIVRGNAFNDKGWEDIQRGQYDSAISHFNQVVQDNPTPDELSEAYNGIGWARSFRGQLKDGMQWFERAVDSSDDAKVGLAAAYLQRASRSDMDMVIELLFERLGNKRPHFKFVPRRNIGVTNAEVHAMLAYAFAATERDEEARNQLEYAKDLAEREPSSAFQQLTNVIEFILR